MQVRRGAHLPGPHRAMPVTAWPRTCSFLPGFSPSPYFRGARARRANGPVLDISNFTVK